MKRKPDCTGISLLVLRIVVAVVFLYHGFPKATNIAMAMDKFVGMGFPGILGPIVGWIEVIAALLLIVGIYFKWANYVLAGIIVVAIIGVQIPAAMKAGKLLPAGLERDLLLVAANMLLAATGPGRYALQK